MLTPRFSYLFAAVAALGWSTPAAGQTQPPPVTAAGQPSSAPPPRQGLEGSDGYLSVEEAEALYEGKGKPSVGPRSLPRHANTVGETLSGFGSRGLGLRTGVAVNDSAVQAYEAVVYERGTGLLYGSWPSGRYQDELWIGGGSEGLSYALSLQAAFGAYLQVSRTHGPFIRFDIHADKRLRGAWSYSALRLPGLQLGWGGVAGPVQFDLATHIGWSLTGSLRFSDRHGVETRHSTKGTALGASWTLALERFRFDGDLSRIANGPDSGELWDLRAHLCTHLGKRPLQADSSSRGPNALAIAGPHAASYDFGLCLDSSYLGVESIRSPIAGSTTSRSFGQFSLGVQFVVGTFSSLDPPAKLSGEAPE